MGYRNTGFSACAGYTGTSLDALVGTEQDTADAVLTDILYHTLDTGIKNNNLAVHGMAHTINRGNTVTDTDNRTVLLIVVVKTEVGNLFF